MRNCIAFIIVAVATSLFNISGYCQANPHWTRVNSPAGIPIYYFIAFDSVNLMFMSGSDAKIYYSSNRGVSWEYSVIPSLTYAHKAKLVKSTAILGNEVDSADYSSADMGRTWTRHPWAPWPAVIDGHPVVKRWYDVGKGWYEEIKEIPQPFPPDLVEYYYLRQDKPWGPLDIVESRFDDFLNPRMFDAADSAVFAFTGFPSVYVNGENRVRFKAFFDGIFQYLGGETWMFYDRPRRNAKVFPNAPASEAILTHLNHPIIEIYSNDSVVIASYVDNYRGAYISKDLGRNWAQMQLHRTEPQFPGIPEFQIVDSLRIFMVYDDTLYYTSDGGGPTIPLASVVAARDARPGVAVFGSVLTVSGGGEVEVLDLLGRRVVRAERSASGEPVKINLLPYPDGIYFVHSGKEITKILWQRE